MFLIGLVKVRSASVLFGNHYQPDDEKYAGSNVDVWFRRMYRMSFTWHFRKISQRHCEG